VDEHFLCALTKLHESLVKLLKKAISVPFTGMEIFINIEGSNTRNSNLVMDAEWNVHAPAQHSSWICKNSCVSKYPLNLESTRTVELRIDCFSFFCGMEIECASTKSKMGINWAGKVYQLNR
jgi:hypothetical protein